MKIIVSVHRVEQPHVVSDQTLLETIEDPRGRTELTIGDAQTLQTYIHNATLRMGPGVSVVAADPGAQTGELLIVRIEILRTDQRLNDALLVIRQVAAEAFARL